MQSRLGRGKKMRKTPILVGIGLVVALTFMFHDTRVNADIECQYTYGSGIAWAPGYGNICCGTGSGCTECIDTETYGACVTDGLFCVPKIPQVDKP